MPKSARIFFAFDVSRIEADDDFRLVAETFQQAHLYVWVETGKAARRMIIEDKFAAEFKIKFLAVLPDPFRDGRGLLLQVFLVVETDPKSHEGT